MKLYQPVIVRKEVDDTHYYYVDGKYFPGVTSILGETEPMPYGLKKWIGDVGNERAEKIRDTAGERGSMLHEICERLILGDTIRPNEDLLNSRDRDVVITGFVNWMRERQPEIVMTSDVVESGPLSELDAPTTELTVAFDAEVPLSFRPAFPNTRMQFAGTLDIFCYLDKEPYIIDIKTGKGIHDNHFLQLAAYKMAFYQMTGIKAKRGILHLTSRAKAKIKFYDEKDMKIKKRRTTFTDFTISYMKYLSMHGGVVPEPPEINVYPEEVELWGGNE